MYSRSTESTTQEKRFGTASYIRENPTWRIQRIHDTEKTQDTTLTTSATSNRGQTP